MYLKITNDYQFCLNSELKWLRKYTLLYAFIWKCIVLYVVEPLEKYINAIDKRRGFIIVILYLTDGERFHIKYISKLLSKMSPATLPTINLNTTIKRSLEILQVTCDLKRERSEDNSDVIFVKRKSWNVQIFSVTHTKHNYVFIVVIFCMSCY